MEYIYKTRARERERESTHAYIHIYMMMHLDHSLDQLWWVLLRNMEGTMS